MRTPIEYIKEAWGIYTNKENFTRFARIMAVLVIVSFVVGFPIGYLYSSSSADNWQNAGFALLTSLSFLIGLWTQTTTYFSILRMESSEKEVFKLGYKNMWKYFLISLVIGLIVLGGTILLIIPGIIFGVWYSFSTFLVLDKGMGIKDALKTSKLMVKGIFWKVLGRFFVIGLFTFFVSLVLTAIPYAGPLATSFVAPLFTLPFYLLYRDLNVYQKV